MYASYFFFSSRRKLSAAPACAVRVRLPLRTVSIVARGRDGMADGRGELLGICRYNRNKADVSL